jgi:hypothetical protein
MNRIRTVTLLLAIGWSLMASAESSWDVVKGNDTGGIISWSPEHQLLAPEWAAEHCARYEKFTRTTSIDLNTAITSHLPAIGGRHLDIRHVAKTEQTVALQIRRSGLVSARKKPPVVNAAIVKKAARNASWISA